MSDSLFFLGGIVPTFLVGAHMLLRPHAYIGLGTPPATDPRTVRFFGGVLSVLGGAPIVLALIQFVQE